jgi:hypothetical protein
MKAGVPTWMDEEAKPGVYPSRSRWERLQDIDLPMHDRLTILYSEIRKGLKRGDQLRLSLRPGLVLDQDRLRTQLF